MPFNFQVPELKGTRVCCSNRFLCGNFSCRRRFVGKRDEKKEKKKKERKDRVFPSSFEERMSCTVYCTLLGGNEVSMSVKLGSAFPPSTAFDYSGGYYNPVLATSLKYGCKGNTDWEHFVVYWLGSSVGAVASIYAYPPLFERAGAKKKEE